MQNINQRMAKGIVWMVGARLLDRSVGIISTLILARLLIPGDFGLIAMATAIGGMLDLLGSFSFDVALIQKADAERRHYDTVWTFNVIFGLICTAGLIFLAGPAAAYYSEPRLSVVMYVLSISYFLGAFGNIGVVNFRKELDFKQEFIFIFARRVVTFIATISAAFILRSYWALLIGMTLGRIVGVWMSYAMNAYRPRFTLSAMKELFHFSKWMFLNNCLVFLMHDGCTFIIGRVFGATGLGIYSVSYEISNLPSTELVAPINRVTFPGFAKMVHTHEIADSYLRLLGMITLLILPVGIGIAAVAEPLVLAALGPKWITAIPLIAILGINGAISATQTNNGSVWLALGKPHLVTIVIFCFLLILFPGIYFCLGAFGVTGAGYAYLISQSVSVPLGMTVTKRLLKFKWLDVVRVVWRPLLASGAMYVAVGSLEHSIGQYNAWLRLAMDTGAGALTYLFVILSLWLISSRPNGAETFCLERAKLI
ncbi:MAG: lipopolysaccharide biosynthesis protein [Glaciimonas sp.]|nr:lipopolysaccharide biosynthesis protein [Glaciimonas sp.]